MTASGIWSFHFFNSGYPIYLWLFCFSVNWSVCVIFNGSSKITTKKKEHCLPVLLFFSYNYAWSSGEHKKLWVIHALCYHLNDTSALRGQTGTDQFPLDVYITVNTSITRTSYDHTFFFSGLIKESWNGINHSLWGSLVSWCRNTFAG